MQRLSCSKKDFGLFSLFNQEIWLCIDLFYVLDSPCSQIWFCVVCFCHVKVFVCRHIFISILLFAEQDLCMFFHRLLGFYFRTFGFEIFYIFICSFYWKRFFLLIKLRKWIKKGNEIYFSFSFYFTAYFIIRWANGI